MLVTFKIASLFYRLMWFMKFRGDASGAIAPLNSSSETPSGGIPVNCVLLAARAIALRLGQFPL